MTEECLPMCNELTQEELNRGVQCNEGRNLDTRFMGEVEEGVCKKCATEHTSKQDLYRLQSLEKTLKRKQKNYNQ